MAGVFATFGFMGNATFGFMGNAVEVMVGRRVDEDTSILFGVKNATDDESDGQAEQEQEQEAFDDNDELRIAPPQTAHGAKAAVPKSSAVEPAKATTTNPSPPAKTAVASSAKKKSRTTKKPKKAKAKAKAAKEAKEVASSPMAATTKATTNQQSANDPETALPTIPKATKTKAKKVTKKRVAKKPNTTMNQPSTGNQPEPQSTPYVARLLQEWKEFETHWTDETTISDYIQSNRSQEELPYKSLPDFILPTPNHSIPSSSSNALDIVLASHMSMGGDKLARLDLLQRSWQGPLSLAVRIQSLQEAQSFMGYYQSHPAMAANWTVHFLLEYPIDHDSFANQYCHNRLRNLALHSPSIPDYVLAVDLDFVPTPGGYPKLMAILEQTPRLWDKLRDQTLLVLPVLEVLHIPESVGMNASTLVAYHKEMARKIRQSNSTEAVSHLEKQRSRRLAGLDQLRSFARGAEADLPASREDLWILYQLNIARPWHTHTSQAPSDLQQYWYGGRNRTQPTYPIVPSTKYEPYFVGYKPKLPRYWEAFRGFGLNKQSFVRECILKGFAFEGLYELYVTHLAHAGNMNRAIKGTNKKIWKTSFGPYLERNYPKPKRPKGKGDKWFALP